MLEVLWSVGAFAVALGVLVSFHEFGHFWVARRLGVKVLRYSIGFGKPLWTHKGADGIEYTIAALPLGGYVKMLDEREGEVPPMEAHRAFNRQNVWKRVAIVAAGPAANFLLAIAMYWLVFMWGMPSLKPILADPPPGTRAAALGLHAKDEIVALDSDAVTTFQELRVQLIEHALSGRAVSLSVRSADGKVGTRVLDLAGVRVDPQYLFEDLGLNPYQPPVPAVLGPIVHGSPAEAAGLRTGDRVLTVNGASIILFQELFDWVHAHPGAVAKFEVLRGKEKLALTAIIATEGDGEKTWGKLGVGVDVPDQLWDNLTTEYQLSVLDAAPAAVVQTGRMSALTLKMLFRMVLGDVSVRNVSGPIQIAQVAGYSAGIGLVSFLSFIAIMSVSLGVLNLLPVPVLDGGHLLFYGVEIVKGSPLSERAQSIGQHVGLTVLIALMGLAFYNDILRLIH